MNASLIDILCRNSDSQRITSLEPDTEYVVFAFGVNEHGESTTRPCKYIFRTGKFAVSDPCTFSITFPEVEQLQFTFTITPDDNTTRYYAGLTETETLDASSADQVAAQFIRQAEIAEIDWNAHDALYSGTITRNTYGDLGISDLEPDTEYSIVVFGVSPLGERTTEVSHESIRTASVPHSGMTFEFDVTETSLEGAVIDIIPSIKTETYMAGTIRKEIFDGFTDETSFMENLIGQGNIVLLEGDQTLDRTGKLLTDTEYICFAFGYIGGITTDLYKVEFLTREPETSGKAEVAIEFEYKTHATYDMAIYANLTPNKETAHWYAGAFNSVDGVIQVPFSGETLSDAEIIVSLTTNESAFYWDSPYAACGAYFGREYTFCVIACDDDGKFGPLVKKTVIAEESLLGEQ